jgi:tetratricopeptide (TPR) repeat protein
VRKSVLFSLLSLIFFISVQSQLAQSNETVVVLPFENASGKPEFNWVGESLADSLSSLLVEKEVRSAGLNSISNQERKIIQESLKIPTTNIPSLATSIRISQKAKANILIYGTYNIVPEQGEIAASIEVKARIIKVDEGKFLTETFSDGSRKMRQIVLKDALANLQTVEAKVLVEVLKQLDKGLTIIENDVVKLSNKVPAKAFEAYIKGLLTPESNVKTREGFFKNAMRLYAEEKADEPDENAKIYTDVALELGHLYLNQKQYANARDNFGKIPTNDSHYAEAAFYSGLIYWQQNNYEQALAILRPLADELKLNSLYNTLGAIEVQASRSEKDKAKAAAYLNQGLEYLKKASESDPDDPESRFNYSIALFLNNDFTQTIEQVRPILTSNQRDGEAYYLLSKAFEKTGNTSAAAESDNQAKRFLIDNNRYAKLETEWQKSKTIDGLEVRVVQPPRKDFVSVILISKLNAPVPQTPVNETEVLLGQARAFLKAGKEENAMQVLRRILSSESNAEAYLLLGKVHLGRSDWEQATHSLKTALFWDNQLIEAHILLAKIFLEKKDCQQAQSYVASALAIDENSQDALGLQRQVERCAK